MPQTDATQTAFPPNKVSDRHLADLILRENRELQLCADRNRKRNKRRKAQLSSQASEIEEFNRRNAELENAISALLRRIQEQDKLVEARIQTVVQQALAEAAHGQAGPSVAGEIAAGIMSSILEHAIPVVLPFLSQLANSFGANPAEQPEQPQPEQPQPPDIQN